MRSIISNIGDCFTDPGELTTGQARRALAIHSICSPSCLILRQAERALDVGGSSTELISADGPGETPRYPCVELIGPGEVCTGYLH